MSDQLTIDGRAVPHPPPRPRRLTERQRELVRVLVAGEQATSTADVHRLYADASGALRRLEALGLARHVAHGKWAAA